MTAETRRDQPGSSAEPVSGDLIPDTGSDPSAPSRSAREPAGPGEAHHVRRAVILDRLVQRPAVRAGAYAWSLIGILGMLTVLVIAMERLAVVLVPLLVAAFPAAVLLPPTRWLRSRGVPATVAALLVLLTALGVLGAVLAIVVPQVADELGGLGQATVSGYQRARAFLEAGPFGLQPVPVDQLVDRFEQSVTQGGHLSSRLVAAGAALAEGLTGLALGLVALFFYLKDGVRIAHWMRDLFPERMREDAAQVGVRVWGTLSDYVRGQLIVAMVNATVIGVGVTFLRVPLALPLAVLVFIGGFFPIIGGLVAGTVALLVALATGGVFKAAAVLALVIFVYQLEGHLLGPVVLGRATQLHPLAVLTALAVGASLRGVFGAFVAVPLTASTARAIGYLRTRSPERGG